MEKSYQHDETVLYKEKEKGSIQVGDEEIRKLQEMIDKSSNIVFFGGPGFYGEQYPGFPQ